MTLLRISSLSSSSSSFRPSLLHCTRSFRPSAAAAASQLLVDDRLGLGSPRQLRRRFGTTPVLEKGLTLGIMRETYDKWERRTPLCPDHVDRLLTKYGPQARHEDAGRGGTEGDQEGKKGGNDPLLEGVIVQPASHRIYSDHEYAAAGAVLSDDLSDADLIFGVKQVDVDSLLPSKSYMMFAHVIKGQPENMDLLRKVLDNDIQLFDYECINEEWIDASSNGKRGKKNKRRLVAFGRYAGIAGMIDSYQCLGRRLLAGGYSTPFLNCPPTYMYDDLTDARAGVERIGAYIARRGLPSGLEPLVFAFTGRGNVTEGSLEIFKLLPHEMITKEELPKLRAEWNEKMKNGMLEPQRKVYGVQLSSADLVRRVDAMPGTTDAEEFDRKHYFDHPQKYESTFFDDVAPFVNVIVNGIYWDERFPRLLTRGQMRELYRSGNRRLLTVADISCDIEGSIEFLTKSTTVEQPYFTYRPLAGRVSSSTDGAAADAAANSDVITDDDDDDGEEISDDITDDGVAMMGVDILPTELPKESSKHFGDALLPLLERLIEARGESGGDGKDNKEKDLSDLGNELPLELANACVANKGYLTPAFEYITDLMRKRSQIGGVDPHQPHVLIELHGHLFDSGLINQVLDVMEHAGEDVHFEFVECNVRRRVEGVPEKSDVLLRVSADDVMALEDVKTKVGGLVDLIVAAEASMECYGDVNAHAAKKKNKKRNKEKNATASSTGGGAEVTSEEEQRVLVLGAGRVAASLSEYLGRSQRRNVVVASQYEDDARAVADVAKRGTGVALDVANDADGLSRLVEDADVVVSLLPAPMHPVVAEECIRHGVDMVTASYVSPEIEALQERCEQAGISILNEVGLDPGMDHMSAMKIIDSVHSRGGVVTSFTSVCGGLPSPEVANTNPLMYKFSWSPMGVMRASQNDALYIKDGEVVKVDGEDLLGSARLFNDAWPSLHLEVLPNRDSLIYADRYGIGRDTAQTVFRGTLRYNGFSELMMVFKNMGLMDDVEFVAGSSSWAEALDALCKKRGFTNDLRGLVLSSSGGDVDLAARAASCLKFLGLTTSNDTATVSTPRSAAQSFCDVLEDRLRYGEDERDMVLMHHDIRASFGDVDEDRIGGGGTTTVERHTSSLQLFGDASSSGSGEDGVSGGVSGGGGGMSAMCKTVGCTAAVGTELLLGGKGGGGGGEMRKGILLPTSRDIYEPCLAALDREGLRFEEVVTKIEKSERGEDLMFGSQ